MYQSRTSHVASDASLYLLQIVEGEPIITHGGKVQKIATLAAGLCSVRFQYHMRDQVFDKQHESKVLLILGCGLIVSKSR